VSADQRPAEAFPRSLAYREQASVKVSAAALALGYAHLHSIEQVAALDSVGMAWDAFQRRRLLAEEAGWLLYEKTLLPAMVGGPRFVPLPPGLEFADDGGTRMHLATDCMAESVRRTVQVLTMPWDGYLAAVRASFDRVAGPPPAAWLHPDDLQALLWLEDSARMMASGQPALQAARIAQDRAQGRPRRKRQPVGREWLLGQVNNTLIACWFSLLHARTRAGEGDYWLRGRIVREDARPVWSCDTPEERG
jgi:hypothetical protein